MMSYRLGAGKKPRTRERKGQESDSLCARIHARGRGRKDFTVP